MRIKHMFFLEKSVRVSVLLGLLTFSLFAVPTSTRADIDALTGTPDLINWINGPARADLGLIAEIEVPAGFRFAGGADAVTVLRSMNNPAPPTLVGILVPNGGSYMVILEYTPIGYIRTSSREKLDPEAILATLRGHLARKNAGQSQAIASMEWSQAPRFDANRKQLEWAIQAQSGSRSMINHVVRQLGRDGVLDAIAVRPSNAGQAVPLKQLMAGVSFKTGYTYADYREGDKIAAHRLSDLMASEEPAPVSEHFPYQWAIAGAIGLLAIGGGAYALNKRRHRLPPRPVSTAPLAHLKVALNGSAPQPIHTTSCRENGVNGNGNGNGHAILNGHGKIRRRRIFDYQRYYSDLMFQVSDRGYEQASTPVRPKAAATRPEVPKVKPVLSDDAQSLAANICLIESQKRLIEEQQRLIREQSKLIEEKTRLIQEKNQVLDKQSELFGNNIF